MGMGRSARARPRRQAGVRRRQDPRRTRRAADFHPWCPTRRWATRRVRRRQDRRR